MSGRNLAPSVRSASVLTALIWSAITGSSLSIVSWLGVVGGGRAAIIGADESCEGVLLTEEAGVMQTSREGVVGNRSSKGTGRDGVFILGVDLGGGAGDSLGCSSSPSVMIMMSSSSGSLETYTAGAAGCVSASPSLCMPVESVDSFKATVCSTLVRMLAVACAFKPQKAKNQLMFIYPRIDE
jgi:hypothetical protein